MCQRRTFRWALYHHFTGKDELFTAVVIDLLHKIAAKVRWRLEGPGTAGRNRPPGIQGGVHQRWVRRGAGGRPVLQRRRG